MTAGVYRIRNTTNDDSYIGSAIDIEKRISNHIHHRTHRQVDQQTHGHAVTTRLVSRSHPGKTGKG
jgi:excinuclease UvrABC nuclease subunit